MGSENALRKGICSWRTYTQAIMIHDFEMPQPSVAIYVDLRPLSMGAYIMCLLSAQLC